MVRTLTPLNKLAFAVEFEPIVASARFDENLTTTIPVGITTLKSNFEQQTRACNFATCIDIERVVVWVVLVCVCV